VGGAVGRERKEKRKIISFILYILHLKIKQKKEKKIPLNQFNPLLFYWNFAVILFRIMSLLDREKSPRGDDVAKREEEHVLEKLNVRRQKNLHTEAIPPPPRRNWVLELQNETSTYDVLTITNL
jgi:hypothetical protein